MGRFFLQDTFPNKSGMDKFASRVEDCDRYRRVPFDMVYLEALSKKDTYGPGWTKQEMIDSLGHKVKHAVQTL